MIDPAKLFCLPFQQADKKWYFLLPLTAWARQLDAACETMPDALVGPYDDEKVCERHATLSRRMFCGG